MKKLFIYALAAALTIGTAAAQTPDDSQKPKREVKTKKAKRDPVAPARPPFDKGPYYDDPSRAKDESPTKVKRTRKAVKSTPDEPKKLKKVKREVRREI
jgi:hypothetical protein